MEKIKRLRAQARAILDEKGVAWSDRPAPRWELFVHFWVLVWRSYVRNRAFIRAAALAYTSILAMVPLLAVAISVSTGMFQLKQETIRELIAQGIGMVAPGLKNSEDPEDAYYKTSDVAKQIQESISNVNSGTLGVYSTLALVFVAVSLLSTVEDTFNDMWGVEKGRNWFARLVRYWSVVSLGSMLVASAFALTGAREFAQTKTLVQAVPFLGHLVFRVFPYVILSLACAFFYGIMPNTKVRWWAALLGGCVGGVLLQTNSSLSVLYVSRVVTNHKLYGGLGTIPVLLVGLYFFWLILLFGSQVAYAIQNRKAYMQEKQAERINQRSREFISLRMITFIAQRFEEGAPAPSSSEIADALGVPLRLVCQLISPLVENRLVVEVNGKESGYFPARPLGQISAEDVLNALRAGQGVDLATSDDASRASVRGEFDSIRRAEHEVASAITVQALVDRVRVPQLSDGPGGPG